MAFLALELHLPVDLELLEVPPPAEQAPDVDAAVLVWPGLGIVPPVPGQEELAVQLDFVQLLSLDQRNALEHFSVLFPAANFHVSVNFDDHDLFCRVAGVIA